MKEVPPASAHLGRQRGSQDAGVRSLSVERPGKLSRFFPRENMRCDAFRHETLARRAKEVM